MKRVLLTFLALAAGLSATAAIAASGYRLAPWKDDLFKYPALLSSDANGDNVVVHQGDGSLAIARRADVDPQRIVRHDAHADDPALAFALSRLDDPSLGHVPMGIFRSVQRPTYDDLVRGQVDFAVEQLGGPATDDDLATLLAGKDSWNVVA